MDTEDGQVFIKNLAWFVRNHENSLANALQLQRRGSCHGRPGDSTASGSNSAVSPSSTSTTLASALSLPYLRFTSNTTIKAAKLTLTPHHLFYLLSRFEDLGVSVGSMNVRLENIHSDSSPTNYVSFLSSAQRNKCRTSDRDSMHSVASIRSVVTGISSLWSNLGLSSRSAAKSEKQKAAIHGDLKYLYSAFTKIPCLKLAPVNKARLISGYEEFPFDSAVPLFVFKNLGALDVCDIDFRQFYGWDRLAEQLRSLTVKRGGVEDPTDLLVNVVLDDMDKRRRRSAKTTFSADFSTSPQSPTSRQLDSCRLDSLQSSPIACDRRRSVGSPQDLNLLRGGSLASRVGPHARQRSLSPARPISSRHVPAHSHSHGRSSASRLRRCSGSSSSSVRTATPRGSSSNLLAAGVLPSSKWRFLKHLCLADNGLTSISAPSLAPLVNSLQSLDISSNLFTEIPDTISALVSLRALNISDCMIESLHSLSRNPLPAITSLNLRANRLSSLAGIERLLSLECLDLRDNKLTDPMELARLTSIPNMQDIYVRRNPFVKTHGNYRITIFNLFRSAPGYADDVVIDFAGPGYSEKKQLVDRVPEKNLPMDCDQIKPAALPLKIIDTSPYEQQSISSTANPEMDLVPGSQRRRKGPKRRIVDISSNDKAQVESPFVTTDQSLFLHKPNSSSCEVNSDLTLQKSSPQFPALENTVNQSSTTSSGAEIWPRIPSELNSNGDRYKKKIEALRNDIGNGWLSALGDDVWSDGHKNLGGSFTASDSLGASVVSRTPNQSIVSGGRTLG